MLTKQQLAQQRNWFKFILMGMNKPVNLEVLTEDEKLVWKQILYYRKVLLEDFNINSEELGLKVKKKLDDK
jgi:hypothetical protein